MKIINDNTFNRHNNLLNNDNRYIKGTLKPKHTEIARELISTDYHEFQPTIMNFKPTYGI